MCNKSENKNSGFSLIELIIVIAILSILVGVLAPQYLKYVEKSKRVVDVTTAKEIVKAFDRVFAIEDTSTTINGKYYTMAGWDSNTSMPSVNKNNLSFLEYVFIDLGQVPKSVTFKKFFWEVDFNPITGEVDKIVLYDKSKNKNYELYPNADDFLNLK